MTHKGSEKNGRFSYPIIISIPQKFFSKKYKPVP